MADDLERLKMKIKCMVQGYLTAYGMMHLDEEPAYIAREFAKALNLNDDQIHTIEHKITYLNGCNEANEWCTEDEGVEEMCRYLLKHPQGYNRKWMAVFEYFFDVVDQNQDGYINAEEFAIFYKSLYYASIKRDDKEFVARAFASIDKAKAGKVSKKQYLDAYLTYFTDPATPYEVMPLF